MYLRVSGGTGKMPVLRKMGAWGNAVCSTVVPTVPDVWVETATTYFGLFACFVVKRFCVFKGLWRHGQDARATGRGGTLRASYLWTGRTGARLPCAETESLVFVARGNGNGYRFRSGFFVHCPSPMLSRFRQMVCECVTVQAKRINGASRYESF